MEIVANLSHDSLENQIYSNFINSLKATETKQIYERNIKYYLKFCNLTKLSELLAIAEPQKQIINYIIALREKGLATSSINIRLASIFHFYQMQDVTLNIKRINMFKGQPTLKTVDRAYTYNEIQKILDVSDLRMKCIVLLMASGGLRVGAIASLKLKHLEKIEQCYKLRIYEGSNEQYYSFCTPECSTFIDSYLDFRAKKGEKLTEQSYLIRNQLNINDIEQARNSKGISTGTIKADLNHLLVKAGVREINHTGYKRQPVARAHGFRKFYSTMLVKAGTKTEYRWLMEGHNLKGNDNSYVKPTAEDLFPEFKKAIDLLTIEPSKRLQRENNDLKVELSRLDMLEASLRLLEQKYKTNLS